ncbi:MAG: right-handed parallel beta-helix repeat-containing protein, partial [bacterium]
MISQNTGGRGGDGYGSRGALGGVGCGIYLYSSTNNIFSENMISQNTGGQGGDGGYWDSTGGPGGVGCGVYLYFSANNFVSQNPISQNTGGEGGKGYIHGSGGRGGLGTGIHLVSSVDNSISNNSISENHAGVYGQEGDQPLWGPHHGRPGNAYGIYIDPNSYDDRVDSLNTYNNEPVFYCYGTTTLIIIENQTLTTNGAGATNLGRIVLINCQNFIIRNNSIAGGIGENGHTSSTNEHQGDDGETAAGIYLHQTDNGSITDNTISDNYGGMGGSAGYNGGNGRGGIGAGIYFSLCDGIVVAKNTIKENRGGYNAGLGCGIYTTGTSNISANNNHIYNNRDYNGGKDYGYGIYNVDALTLDAEYNWWSTNSGPYHPDTNPSGRGDRVSNWVDYDSWITISPCFIYVDDNNTSGTENGTLEYPYNTIQEGVEACPEEGTVSVASGTYTQPVYITKQITLVGKGSGTTIINVSSQDAVTFSGSGISISGFRITGATSRGIYCHSGANPIITNNTIIGNKDGILCGNSTITNNTIIGNSEWGIECSSSLVINNTVTGNKYGISCSNSTITNNIITGNDIVNIYCPNFSTITNNIITGSEHGIWCSANSFITNNTLTGNRYGIWCDSSSPIITNNIITENGTTSTSYYGIYNDDSYSSGNPTIDYNCIWSNGLNGNNNYYNCSHLSHDICVDPQFLPSTFHLLPSSPCIDAGSNTAPAISSTDKDGKPRIMDGNSDGIAIVDMGAYELPPPTFLRVIPQSKIIAKNDEFNVDVKIDDVRELAAAQVYLLFNPGVLEVRNITPGSFPPSAMNSYNTNTSGCIYCFAGLFTGSASGSGILFSARFKGKEAGTSSLKFGNNTVLANAMSQSIPFNKDEGLFYIAESIRVYPENKTIKAGERESFSCFAQCGAGSIDVTGSTTWTTSGGGSFTANSFEAHYIGTYTIQGEFLGLIGTTSVVITPGTPTDLLYVSGNNQTQNCQETLADPFVCKVEDFYHNPCNDVLIDWLITENPSGASGFSLSATQTLTNINGTSATYLTLGTEPPGTYTIEARNTSLSGSPVIFKAYSLRRFGSISGTCLIDRGTEAQRQAGILVRLVETGETKTTNANSEFIFSNIPVGTYTLAFTYPGATPATKTDCLITKTQFNDTTDIGTITLIAGDPNGDGQINILDWPPLADSLGSSIGSETYNPNCDFNQDGVIDIWDFMIFRDNFGETQTTTGRGIRAIKAKSSGNIALGFSPSLIENAKPGDVITLNILISLAKNSLCGEIHLTYDQNLLCPIEDKLQPGNWPTQATSTLKNRVKDG